MPRYWVTIWTEYATTHEVDACSEEQAVAKVEADYAATEIDTYYGDAISTEVDMHDAHIECDGCDDCLEEDEEKAPA